MSKRAALIARQNFDKSILAQQMLDGLIQITPDTIN
jgi:hypothetical protein